MYNVEMKSTNNTPANGPPIERDQLKSAKIAVLKLINEHKEILFGKLSDTLTREVKEGKWADVADLAHELGAFPWHRSWDYLKDTTWQNWRKRFVEKREKKEKFEKLGLTSKILYDEADLLIMEILDSIGKNIPLPPLSTASLNNPVVSGSEGQIRDISDILEIAFEVKNEGDLDEYDVTDGPPPPGNNQIEVNVNGGGNADQGAALEEFQQVYDNSTGFQNHNGHNHSTYLNDNGHDDEEDDVTSRNQNDASNRPKIISTSSLASPQSRSRASLLRKTAFASLRSGGIAGRKRPASCISLNGAVSLATKSVERELIDLKCRKIRAELELLNRESYKKDLEILQLERSLGLPASHITKKFYKYAGTIPRGMANNHSNNR